MPNIKNVYQWIKDPHEISSILVPFATMPFPLRPISPTHLSKSEIPSDMDNPLEYITNTTLTQAMRQLASLLRQADDLFQDLGDRCNNINLSTNRINMRVTKLREKVEKYNPRKEKLRKIEMYNKNSKYITFLFILAAGDLVTFSKLKVHYKTEYPIESNLFTKENRTQAIKTLYAKTADGKETEVRHAGYTFNQINGNFNRNCCN